jgi:predicted lipase
MPSLSSSLFSLPSYDEDIYSSLSVNRLSYCTKEQINRFTCEDCSGRRLIGSYDPSSKASSQVVVVIDKKEEEILIGFRGTINNPQQWISDLDAVYKKWYSNGRVHSGFFDRFNEIKDKTVIFLREAQKELPKGDIIISGHSMGGAVATLFGSYIKSHLNIDPEAIYTYGSPRVGDETFAKYVDSQFGDKLIRIMNEWDMVTDLPPVLLKYRHTGKLVICKTGTTDCKEKNRLDENPGGIIMSIKRTIETAKNVKKCHLTYLEETIGTNRYKCV